jgi:hypothetical protein
MELELDDRAREWLRANHNEGWAVDYDVHRCCGGGKICEVRVRADDGKRSREDYVQAVAPDGSRFLIDPRAARRLPSRVKVTVGGLGSRKHLDLELSGEEWGDLLYT